MPKEFRLQADSSCDFEGFTTLLKSLVDNTMEGVTFVEAFPSGTDPEQIKPPLITYKVMSRVPSNKEITPKIRELPFEDPNQPNKTILIYGQKFDYIIEFSIWCATNESANKLMNEFEDTLIIYKGDLMRSGVQNILFNQQLEDNSESSSRVKLAHRTLLYQVRLEKLTSVSSSKLNMITVRVNGDLVFKVED